LAACYTPPPTVDVPPVEVAASFERTWAATLYALADARIPVAAVDKASGLVTSAPFKVEYARAAGWGNCGSNPTYPMAITDGTLSVLVRGTDAASSVRITPRWSMTDKENTIVCATTGGLEKSLEAKIRSRLAQ
jgi:hypothetical protein